MQKRYHLPTQAAWLSNLPADERARIERAILLAIDRAVKKTAPTGAEILATDRVSSEAVRESFEYARYQPEDGTYPLPSYQQGGELTPVPVIEQRNKREGVSPSPALRHPAHKLAQVFQQSAPAGHVPLQVRRQRAKALKAADARTLLQASLPFVLEHMTDEQVQQMQRVLDATIVNPDVLKEAEDLYRRSIVAQIGSQTTRDPRKVRRADRAMESFIQVTEADKRIRLDFEALLTPEALKATTDNPDEAAYLKAVRRTLATRGVWLRFAPKLVRDPDDPNRHVIDERTFNVWLSLGPEGDTIPTESGRLTRDTLLNTTSLGAGYYRRVDKGAIQSALDKEIRRLLSQNETGLTQHQMFAKIRRDAFVGVAGVSDVLGGADFPDQSIWDRPHKLVVRALELNVGGNVSGSQAFLVTAAILTRNAGRLLADYIEDSGAGAERAVTVLKVVKTAGEVAEVGLAVTGVVGIVRGTAAIAGEAGAAGASAATGGSVDAAAERLVGQYVAENPAIAGDLANVRWVPGPRGSVGGGVKPGSSHGAGTGWHKW